MRQIIITVFEIGDRVRANLSYGEEDGATTVENLIVSEIERVLPQALESVYPQAIAATGRGETLLEAEENLEADRIRRGTK